MLVLTDAYMIGRKSYLKGGTRPQAMLFADTAGTLTEGGYWIPTRADGGTPVEGEDFIILSDHNRADISMSQQRIESRQRMINGNMRSYWVADKLTISTSWNRLPSRPFSESVTFNSDGEVVNTNYQSYTVDGAAGGVDMLTWYENHPGPFWVYLAYDKYRVNGTENFNHLYTYNEVLQVYFSSFEYSIEKRSANTADGGFDFWNVSIGLEQV